VPNAQARLTVLNPKYAVVADTLRAQLSTVDITDDPARPTGRGYYTGLCFKVFTDDGVELADGGFVDWTQTLLGNRKERLMISGIGLDRLATVLANG
jgi:hypothetical protein